MNKLKKKKLYLMCGIPGSGKTTWIQNHITQFDEKVGVISRDVIRFSMVKEDEEYFSKENDVFKEFVRQGEKSLKNNIDTIMDATHLNMNSRIKILRALKNSLKDVEINVIVIKTDESKYFEQNDFRKGTRSFVPHSVLRRMATNFTMPQLEEGFDHIYIVEGDEITIIGE